ncbi:BnaC03g61640D [Brassica napus]|uniref:BnaC03g61640D protein n=1 Tax=Brassica napus TaxID=3708 RepID=A0A078GAP7_BRANA|nr:BnaC03g61640D [Brassica napus]
MVAKSEPQVMEKGKKSKKHEPLRRSSKGVAVSGVPVRVYCPSFIACMVQRFVVKDGDDDDGDDLPGNPSALPNVVIEGNERLETSSPGTSSSGPATKKPLLSKSGQEGMKSLSE